MSHDLPHDEIETPGWVYHVGDLTTQPESRDFSYEGNGLSVTPYPDAWRQIASSVTGTTYTLVADNATLYKADPTEVRDRVREWCLDHGYVTEVQGWKGGYTDAGGTEHYVLKYDYDKVRSAFEPLARGGYIVPCNVLDLTDKSRQYWEHAFGTTPSSVNPLDLEGMLPVWYAHENGFDGVWWPERYAPTDYSAPRGVLFQDCLDKWTAYEGEYDNPRVIPDDVTPCPLTPLTRDTTPTV